MSLLDKKYVLTINLEDSTITYPLNMSFFNTDKNIANLYVKVQYRDDVIKYISKTDAVNYNIKLTVIKPKSNNLKEVQGVITNDFEEDYAIYKFELPSEFTDQVGLVVCEFLITNANEVLTTSSFSYTIKASKVTGLNPEIIPNPDLPVLKQLIEDVKSAQQWISNIDDVKSSEVKTYSSKKIEDIKTKVDEQFNTIVDDLSNKSNVINSIDITNFGVVGNGVYDDSQAFLKALNYASENKCKLTCKNLNITIKNKIDITFNQDLLLEGDNTAINFNLESVDVAFKLTTSKNVYISKGLKFDFNNSSFIGIYIQNNIANSTNIVEVNSHLMNCKRSNTSFDGGDILKLNGCFKEFKFNGIVENCVLGVGAGIQGSQGVSGVSVVTNDRDNLYCEKVVIGDNAIIKNIYCEDEGYLHDQDGIRVFGHYTKTRLYVSEKATFIDCRGRFIKSQVKKNFIGGNYLCEKRQFKVAGIDCQHGGLILDKVIFENGLVSDLNNLISIGASNIENKKDNLSTISNLKIFSNSKILSCIITGNRGQCVGDDIKIDNVYADCEIESFLSYGVNGSLNNANLKDIYIKTVKGYLVYVFASGTISSPSCILTFENCVNTSTTKAHLVRHKQTGSSASAVINKSLNNQGFIKKYESGESYTVENDTNTYALAKNIVENMSNNLSNFGSINNFNPYIDASSVYKFDKLGYSSNNSYFVMITGVNVQAYCLAYVYKTTITIIKSEWTVGITGTERYQLAIEDGCLVFKNTHTSGCLISAYIFS